MIKSAYSDSRGSRAFSLVEILVATAVLSLVVVFMVSIVGWISGVWRNLEADNQRRSASRILLQLIGRELEAAARPLPMPGAAAVPANLQMIGNLSENAANATSIPQELLSPHAIFWQAPIAHSDHAGKIASVGYFLRWTAEADGAQKPVLCRFFSAPDDPDHFLVYDFDGPAARDWLSAIPSVASAVAPDYRGWLSENVIGLWVRFLDSSGRPITKNAAGQSLDNGYGFDSRQGFQTADGEVFQPNSLPPWVEIALVVVDTRTASLLRTRPTATTTTPADFWRGETTPGSIRHFLTSLPSEIRSGARIFSTRIRLAASDG